MTGFLGGMQRPLIKTAMVCAALVLGSCSINTSSRSTATAVSGLEPAAGGPKDERRAGTDVTIEDLRRIPQRLDELAAAAGDRLALADDCRDRLLNQFRDRFFAPWSASASGFDPAESRDFMRQQARVTWYGVNKRKVAPAQRQELLENCNLESFPSRNDSAIAAAPGHLRGLPTHLPLYGSREGAPFDMLSFPQVKLNEPLRVLHASRDGAWLFVETGYSNGWLDRRDVALVDGSFVDAWMRAPHLVVVRDYAPVPDGRGVAVFRCKVGTILPLSQEDEKGWEVRVASAGEGGKVESRAVRIPRETAAPFPLAFKPENLALIGNQMLGQPYGWGEIYDLRDCSALLRDFFLSFGIWLPRTSGDQMASLPQRVELARMAASEKQEVIRRKGVPFLSLLYKPGHIMLYVGLDGKGRPLVFHDAWSVGLKAPGEEASEQEECETSGSGTQVIGVSAITTLEPGKELGLVPGGSLLERSTELGTITSRCQERNR